MRISLPSFAAGALAAILLVAVPSSALNVTARQAANPHPRAYDGTAPLMTLQRPAFLVGQSIGAADAPTPGDPCDSSHNPFNGATVRLQWTSSDPISGIDAWEVWWDGAQHPDAAKLATLHSTRHFDINGTNEPGACGGGQEVDNRWWVVAKDNRGNTATSGLVTPYIKVWQEDGTDATEEQAKLPLTKHGTWNTSTCTCFNHGKTLYSTTRGASLVYRVTVDSPGQVLAVVADKNTNRGRLEIKVDGGPATSVPTFSSSPRHTVIVVQKALGQGEHRVELINAGSPSHPRVAIDTLMLTAGLLAQSPPDPS
jgi:hypothetical protein